MFKIAVCDDNREDLSNIVTIINDYIAAKTDRHAIDCVQFTSAVDLLSAMEHGQLFDLILLDIIMPLTTGMDAANEIRQFNKEVKIVFLTSSSEFAVQSYAVNAFYYVLKPVRKPQLFSLLDKVISDLENQKGSSFLIKSKHGLIRIYINKLEFAEVIGRTIFYHLTDGSVTEALGSMAELERVLLSHPCFIKPHRSYIINMSHIEALSQREIKMHSRTNVPMVKANYSAIRSAYISFAFRELKTNEIF